MSPGAKGCACLVGALTLVAAAARADTTRADTGLTVETPAAGGNIHALIGSTAELQPVASAAVIRLGPADANWNFGGPPADDLTCLTQAVYYEARSESVEGQEGVAQVVLNRSRTPGFPSAVCDVVYQRTGFYGTCQFTFVCDGSMDRVIEPAAWERAQAVAAQALHGFVYKPLKDAIHYHAAWMTPYWSYSLPRIRQIGGHIFYR
ncbi:MAG TPA: cell wall hydrolase [Caulobacteraceae bacterium]|nr:cell wall hydrolase [Caulobacteraceae bacterium]